MEMIHKFEEAGLGKAPFRFVGMYKCQGTHCDYCGTGIVYVFNVKSSDNKIFKVGSDCIYRVWAEAPNKWAYTALYNEVEKAKKAFMKKAKEEAQASRLEEAFIALEEDQDLLTKKPHPNTYYASQGKTLRDYVKWLLVNGGASGRDRAFKLIETKEG